MGSDYNIAAELLLIKDLHPNFSRLVQLRTRILPGDDESSSSC